MVLIPKITEDKIAELDKRLEELPDVREGLVSKYREEKEERLKNNKRRDYLEERANENAVLFNIKKSEMIDKVIESLNVQKLEMENYGRKR